MTILLSIYIWVVHKTGRADEPPVEIAWGLALLLDWALAMVALVALGAN